MHSAVKSSFIERLDAKMSCRTATSDSEGAASASLRGTLEKHEKFKQKEEYSLLVISESA